MNNIKSFKWGYGIAVALVLALTGCYMDQSPQESNYTNYDNTAPKNQTTQAAAETKSAQKSYASKEPTQKSTPGPKRTAAPQIPVIQ